MRIVDFLKKEAVVLNAEVSTKEQMLDLLVDLHKEVGNIKDKAAFKAGIMKRESEGPTAIAEGICIPHSKNEAVINPGIAALTVPSGVDCEALDGEPSNLYFMIAAPGSTGSRSSCKESRIPGSCSNCMSNRYRTYLYGSRST